MSVLGWIVLSGLTFLAGALISYMLSERIDVAWLIPFAAGNFLYIGATDLVPEIGRQGQYPENLWQFAAFLLGIALMLGLGLVF